MKKRIGLGSITKEKARNNDDFGLSFDGVNNIVTSNSIPTMSSLNDWSHVFFATINNLTENCIFSSLGTGITLTIAKSNTLFSYRIRVSDISPDETITFTSTIVLPRNSNYFFYCLNYNSLTNSFSLYVNSVFIATINRVRTTPFTSNSNVIHGRTKGGSFFFKGLVRDIATFNKQLTQSEITYIYQNNVLPQSTHESCQFHLPLNQVAFVNGANRQFKDVVSNYNYAKVAPIVPKICNAIGWTDDQLGLNVGTSTFLAYADFYTKVAGQNFIGGGNSIIYKGKELRKYGLTFNGINQYLSIPNFNPTAKNITILVGYKTASNGFLLSKNSTGNGIREQTSVATTSHISQNGTTTVQANYNANQVDKVTWTCSRFGQFHVKGDSNVAGGHKTNLLTIQNGIRSGNNDVITVRGFNEESGDLIIGANSFPTLNTYLNGTIVYLAIWIGNSVLNDKEVSEYINNGLCRNPEDTSPITKTPLQYFIDFNNPYLDVATLKFPNLALTNDPAVANGWVNLTALQSSRTEILSLI